MLHKEGKICRLTDTRNRCSVYVLPQFVNARPISKHGRIKNDTKVREAVAADVKEFILEHRLVCDVWSCNPDQLCTLGLNDRDLNRLIDIVLGKQDV